MSITLLDIQRWDKKKKKKMEKRKKMEVEMKSVSLNKWTLATIFKNLYWFGEKVM